MNRTTTQTTRTPSLRPLLLLELATLLSGTGNAVASVALPWLILERTGSATAAGIVASATAIPLLLSTLFSGTLVDLIGHRRMAIISDLLSAAAVAAIPLVDATLGLGIWSLSLLAVLGAIIDPAGITARETLLPVVTRQSGWRLERVNSLHEAIWGVAYLVGPGIGGVLIAFTGAANTLLITMAGFAFSALLLGVMRVATPPATLVAAAAGDSTVGRVWHATLEGITYVRQQPLLLVLAIIAPLLMAFYIPIEGVVLPYYFQQQGRPERLGIMLMAMSAGAIVGSLAYGALAQRLPRRLTYLGSVLGMALGMLGMAFLPPFGVLVVCSALVGLAYGPFNPLTNYAMQTRTPEHLRGRVVGLLTSTGYAAGPLGYLSAGPLVQWLGVRPTLLIFAILLLLVSVAFAPLQALRTFDDAPPYPPDGDGDSDGNDRAPGLAHLPIPSPPTLAHPALMPPPPLAGVPPAHAADATTATLPAGIHPATHVRDTRSGGDNRSDSPLRQRTHAAHDPV